MIRMKKRTGGMEVMIGEENGDKLLVPFLPGLKGQARPSPRATLPFPMQRTCIGKNLAG